MLKWIILLVLTEVFSPFKDDIAILTKFKPSCSEGTVTNPCFTFLPFVCLLCPFFFFSFCWEPLGNHTSVNVSHWYCIWARPFAMGFASQLLAICWQLSWLRSNSVFTFMELGAFLGWGIFTPSYMIGVCIACAAYVQESDYMFYKEWTYWVCCTFQLICFCILFLPSHVLL